MPHLIYWTNSVKGMELEKRYNKKKSKIEVDNASKLQ